MAISAPQPTAAMLVAAVPIPQRLVLARAAALTGRHWVVEGYAQEHAAGIPLEDVDHSQERLKQGDEQHWPGDVEGLRSSQRANHSTPSTKMRSSSSIQGPHNLAVRIEWTYRTSLTTDYWQRDTRDVVVHRAPGT